MSATKTLKYLPQRYISIRFRVGPADLRRPSGFHCMGAVSLRSTCPSPEGAYLLSGKRDSSLLPWLALHPPGSRPRSCGLCPGRAGSGQFCCCGSHHPVVMTPEPVTALAGGLADEVRRRSWLPWTATATLAHPSGPLFVMDRATRLSGDAMPAIGVA